MWWFDMNTNTNFERRGRESYAEGAEKKYKKTQKPMLAMHAIWPLFKGSLKSFGFILNFFSAPSA